MITLLVSVGGPLGIALFTPEWWKEPLGWPRGIYLFLPVLLFIAYYLGKGYSRARKPIMQTSELRSGRDSSGNTMVSLTVSNRGPGAIIPRAQVLPVEDQDGQRLTTLLDLRCLPATPDTPRPVLTEGAEFDIQIASIFPRPPAANIPHRLYVHSSPSRELSLETGAHLTLTILLTYQDQDGWEGPPKKRSVRFIPDPIADNPFHYKVREIDPP